MVTGPRQCGKTSLVRGFTSQGTSPWMTIQCWKLLGAIPADSYVDLIKPLSMKCNALQIYCVPSRKPIDVDRRPGRFLQTGSANAFSLPQVSARPRILTTVRCLSTLSPTARQVNLRLVNSPTRSWKSALEAVDPGSAARSCGCNEIIRLRLLANASPSWRVSLDRRAACRHLAPSVWRTKGCRSHFFLREAAIVLCRSEGRASES